MKFQPVQDIPYTPPFERFVTFNLNPDLRRDILGKPLEHVFQLPLNLCSEYTSPEAAGRGLREPGKRGRRGGGGGRRAGRGGREGPRKRHPNFAARNRKIGKGGPTGRGAFSGQKKRRPTGPAPPDDSDGEIKGYEQDVDMNTGRIKRRQRPKSDEAKEKERRRREEDETRKFGKKIRPGPKRKDRKEMKEKVKRFWRETPQTKHKNAPKILLDGFESERDKEKDKTKRKNAPEDFDDLRMPSREKLKKQRKAEKKNALRKQRKRERKKFNEDEEKYLIGDEKEPTLSEMEGIKAEFGQFMDEEYIDPANATTMIDFKKRLNYVEKYDTINEGFLPDNKVEYGAYMKQLEEYKKSSKLEKEGEMKYGVENNDKEEFDNKTKQDTDLLNAKHQFEDSLKAFEEEIQSDIEGNTRSSRKNKKSLRSFNKKTGQKNSSTEFDQGAEDVFKGKSLSDVEKEFDLFMEQNKTNGDQQQIYGEKKETRNQSEVGFEQSEYENKQDPNLFDNEHQFEENLKAFQEQQVIEDDIFGTFENQNNTYSSLNNSIGKTDSLAKHDQAHTDASDEEETTETKQIQEDDLTEEPECDEDFERDYEGIKKYLSRDSETITSDKADPKLSEKDEVDKEEFTSASDDDEVWNSAKGKFVKARKKKKKKKVSVEFEGAVSEGKKRKEKLISDKYQSVVSKFNKRSPKAKETFLKSLEEEILTDDEDNELDVKDTSKLKENNVNGSVDRMKTTLHVKPTGTVVDEKLEAVRERLNEFNFKKNYTFDKTNLIDEIGQMLYNEDEGMFNIEGDSDRGEVKNGHLLDGDEGGIDMKDYENYISETGNNTPTEKSTEEAEHPELKQHVQTENEGIESGESSTDSEKEASSESYREEYDVALMAGFRSNRIRVFDKNVSLYADQDHQAKNFESKIPTETHKTLSDLENEIAMKNGKFIEQKNDEVLISTESEELEEKSDKRGIKKSDGKKIISSDSHDIEKNEWIDKSEDRKKVDSSEFTSGENELVPEMIIDMEAAQAAEPIKSDYSDVIEPRETSVKENDNTNLNVSALNSLSLEISKVPDPRISMKEDEKPINVYESKSNMDQEIHDQNGADNEKTVLTQQKPTPKALTEDINLFEGLLDDKEEEEETPKDNSILKEEWRKFATVVNECFDHHVEFPMELPDECPSEEEEPIIPSLYDQYMTSGFGNDVFMKSEDAEVSKTDGSTPSETPETEEIKVIMEPEKEESENMVAITNQNTQVEPVGLQNGINEYLEEDQWDLWYKFLALMNNDNTRTYDNCAALFKAKKQEILTRKKAPIPPWDEPGLDEYEKTSRKLQREWEKTERFYALESQQPFNEFLQDNEGEPKEEVYDSEFEETIRFIFDLIGTSTKEYNHQDYKDTLSREELAEIYSEDEVEEELQFREFRKREKEKEANKKTPENQDYLNSLDTEDPLDTFENLFMNDQDTEFNHHSTLPDYMKNNQLNPTNSQTNSSKMGELGNSVSTAEDQNEGIADVSFNIKPINSMENLKTVKDDKIQVNKREQTKKMWQYFQQLMRDRHEKNIDKFLTTYSPTKKDNEEDARRLWQQYVAFSTGKPITAEISADASVTRPEENQQSLNFTGSSERDLSDPGNVFYEKPQERPLGKFTKEPVEVSNTSPVWKNLLKRIDTMKIDPSVPEPENASSPPGTGQPQRSDYGMESQYRGETPSSWDPLNEQYRTAPSYDAQGTYPPPQAQVPYNNAYDQAYEDPRRVPPRGAAMDPYYAPPAPTYDYGYSSPQRGLQGVSQYHSQFTNQRGNYYDPFGKQLPPNVSMNRAYRSADMGFQNPYFSRTDDRAAYMGNQVDPYTANRSRVGWPGDQSDKFHNRKYFIPDMGGHQTYIPRDFSGQPGDHSDGYLNRSNFRNPNLGYRNDTYNNPPFAKPQPEYNPRSIKWWRSGTRPLASAGLQTAPPVENNPQVQQNGYEPTREDSVWPNQGDQPHNTGTDN